MKLIEKTILLEATPEEIRVKYYAELPEDEFIKVIEIDPTTALPNRMGNFSKWLLNRHKKGDNVLDKAEELKKQLTLFNSIKDKLPAENRDINQYKTIDEFIEFIKSKDPEAKSDFQLKAEKQPGVKFIGKTDKFEVYQPLSYEGSKWLRGDDAVWCTGRHNDNSYYNSYTSNGGKLFIFLNMKDGNYNTCKYQVAIRGGHVAEFRDARNESVNFGRFIADNDLIDAVKDTEIAQTPEYQAIKILKDKNGVITYSALMGTKYTDDNAHSSSSAYKSLLRAAKVIIVDDGIKRIADFAFAEAGAEKIIMPESVVAFGTKSFCYCMNLREIKIPSQVTIIPTRCFQDCARLEKVYFGNNLVEIKQYAFEDTPTAIQLITTPHKIKVPVNEKEWYLSHIVRTQTNESLTEDFSKGIPSWLLQFLKNNKKEWGGYSRFNNLKRYFRGDNIDLSNVKVKNLKVPQTKAELEEILNNQDIIPIIYIPMENNPNNKSVAKGLRLSNESGWGDVERDILHIPNMTTNNIAYEASSSLDRFSKKRLFQLISGCSGVKMGCIDKTNNSNFNTELQQRRADSRSGIENPRYRNSGNVMAKTYQLKAKPGAYERYTDFPDVWDTEDNRARLQRYLDNYTQGAYDTVEKKRVDLPLKDLYQIVATSKFKKQDYGMDASGYQIQDLKTKYKERLAEYKAEHYLESYEKLAKRIEDFKTKLKETYESVIQEYNSDDVYQLADAMERFTGVVTAFNEMSDKIEVALKQEDEAKRKVILRTLFEDSRDGSIYQVNKSLDNAETRLNQVAGEFIESLKNKK